MVRRSSIRTRPSSVSSDPAFSGRVGCAVQLPDEPLSAKSAPVRRRSRAHLRPHRVRRSRSSLRRRHRPRPRRSANSKRPKLKISRKAVLAAAALVIVAGGGVYASRYMIGAGVAAPKTGTLVVQSNPAGVPVFVDGNDYGQTPARFVGAGGPAHSRAARARRAPRDQRQRHGWRRGFAVSGVCQHAGDRQPACRDAAGRRQGHGRRHRPWRRAGDHQRSAAWRS